MPYRSKRMAVHPRWRGEQAICLSEVTARRGSSPLARGTVARRAVFLGGQRFIPAGAGNSGQERKHGADHCGSSPLARGTVAHRTTKHSSVRFIPAGAGNSSGGASGCTPTPVHPRWRGEQVSCKNPRSRNAGSSPLARGTAARSPRQTPPWRFIPAGAGNRTCMCSNAS